MGLRKKLAHLRQVRQNRLQLPIWTGYDVSGSFGL
jgi:hypothetical protein